MEPPSLDMKGQKVLITGGLGFIGSNLAHRCLELGAEVTIYDCLDPHSGGNTFNIASIRNDVRVVLNDIRNFEGICAAILNQDILFNCAAFTSHPNSMKEPLIDIDVNCKGVINVLEAARRFNHEIKLVHIGTSTQIGTMRREVIDELHPEFPVDIYSANKSASEKYVLVYAHAYKLRASVIRLANVYGPRSNINSPEFGFMNYFIGLGLRGREITVFGEGRQMRNISHVSDSVEALVLASQSDAVNNKALFAVSDQHFSVAQIGEAIAEHVGGSIRCVPWPKEREVIEVGDAVITNEAFKRLVDWRQRYDLATGLQQTRDYFLPVLADYLR